MTESGARRRPLRAVKHAIGVVIDVIEPDENPAGAVYGTITCGALLAAEGSGKESLAHAAGAVTLGLVLYWLAHAYAAALGSRLQKGAKLSVVHVGSELIHGWAIIRGAFIPLIVLLLSAAAGAGARQAITAALISAAALLVLLEVVAGVRSHLAPPEMTLHVLIGVLLGVGILALRVILA